MESEAFNFMSNGNTLNSLIETLGVDLNDVGVVNWSS